MAAGRIQQGVKILPEGRGVNDLLGRVRLTRGREARGRVLGEGRGVNGILGARRRVVRGGGRMPLLCVGEAQHQGLAS
jgi:hypothetical protein